jgi:multimeric flavodoxin WrbA
MNALVITDKDSKTGLSEALEADVTSVLGQCGAEIEMVELSAGDAAPCFGCLLCLTKHPGECVSKDLVNDLKKRAQQYTMTIFLTPVVFGHFSSTIKNAVDRIGGSHELQVIIGYGQDIDDEEGDTFIDLTARHRGAADVVHPGMDRQVDAYVTRSFQDNERVCEAFNRYVQLQREP